MAQEKKVFTDLSIDDLLAKIAEEKLKYRKMKFTHAISSVENPMQLRSMRRDIARMLTELKKRQLTNK